MKKMKRFASAALAALLLAGSAPSALALDTTPPMYKQFGYDSAEDFTRSYLGNFVHFDYDTASDMFRRYVQQLHADPSLGFSYFGLELCTFSKQVFHIFLFHGHIHKKLLHAD